MYVLNSMERSVDFKTGARNPCIHTHAYIDTNRAYAHVDLDGLHNLKTLPTAQSKTQHDRPT